MKGNNCKHFTNTDCEYYPCHNIRENENFNCLFCYCPLYALGDKCGGNFVFLESGIKDCSNCMLPHSDCGYDYIIKMYPEICKLACKKNDC